MDNWLWIITGVSIAATILNVKKKRVCFVIWCFTNLTWAVVDFVKGMYAQSFLFIVYFALAVWGLVAWRRRKL